MIGGRRYHYICRQNTPDRDGGEDSYQTALLAAPPAGPANSLRRRTRKSADDDDDDDNTDPDTMAARLSPTANLLRKSRVFAVPPTLKPPQDPPTSKAVYESDTATLPHPIRASIVTPPSSLSRGDWGLKRPLPSKSTTEKSSKPVVRVNAMDTFEHVTDFESAADHTMTLEKFQEMHLPMSLPVKVNFANNFISPHSSPFEETLDNTETSKEVPSSLGARRFRQSGPWLAGQTEAEFQTYLQKVRRNKPELVEKLRGLIAAKRTAERRKAAQDTEGLQEVAPEPVTLSEEEFQAELKTLRADSASLGPIVFELLDLPSPPAVPSERMSKKYFQSPPTQLASPEYAVSGPPRTHPSAGLSYTRSHASLYNHPQYGPQTHSRPVQARILRPKHRFRGKGSNASAGIGGFVAEDMNGWTFSDGLAPGMSYFDASIPGGGKYWATPVRASVDSNGRVGLASFQASPTTKAPYAIEGLSPTTSNAPRRVADATRDGRARYVMRLDPKTPRYTASETSNAPEQEAKDVARNLINTLNRS